MRDAADIFISLQSQCARKLVAASKQFCSRFLRALFQFSKRAAGEATKFGSSGVEFLGAVGAACAMNQRRKRAS